ncbi:MAG: methyltransferase family protein [Dissulfurispiraceae bacterium]
MTVINMRPPRIAMLFTGIAATLHLIPEIWDGYRFSMHWVGISLGLIGLFTMMWAWLLFKKRNVAICPTAKTAILITQGPYRFSRNPMYMGMILILLGLAIYVGTPPFYLSTIAYFAIINFIFCPYEEDKLYNSFGNDYIKYRNRVRQWI